MRHKICFLDLDGTVNSSSDVRAHLVPTQPMFEENWAAWHAAHIHEKPNHAVIEVVRALQKSGWSIVLLSMRGDQCFHSTRQQLKAWGLSFDSATLKSPRDNRSPGVFKADEITSVVIAAGHMGQSLDVLLIDDSAEVCDAVRAIETTTNCKINVLQVEPFKG